MRPILIGFLLCLAFGGPARAEQRSFLVANDADGYGIDRCLASGAKCGAAAANAYCKTQAFTTAVTYHKVDPDDLTGAISRNASGNCQNDRCEVIAIVCLR